MSDKISWSWAARMAWRDSRSRRGRFLLFVSSIMVGIAALVAIDSFRVNLDAAVNEEAKTLLGADLVLRSNRAFNDNVYTFLDTLPNPVVREISFSTMIYFPKTGNSRLGRLRAIEEGFPFYGSVKTNPADVYEKLGQSNHVLIDETMLVQYGAQPGDSVRIGYSTFEIGGAVKAVSGETAAGSTIAPMVFLPMSEVEKTGLLQFGSIAIYRAYIKSTPNQDIDAFVAANENFFKENSVRYRTVESRKRQLGRVIGNLNAFLSLIGFFALLLGGIGVASAVNVHVRQKLDSVAILRSLGGGAWEVFAIYLLQTLSFGFIGAVLGVIFGVAVQFGLPLIFQNFLPVTVNVFVVPSALLQGLFAGFFMTSLFTLLPLVALRRVPPLRSLRASYEGEKSRDPLQYLILALLGLFFLAFVALQVNNWQTGAVFSLALLAAIVLFGYSARFVVRLIRRFFPKSWPYAWRQGLANLYRPNNQSSILILSLGLGAFLISTMFLTQDALLRQVSFSDEDERPNLVLFDVQSDQLQAVEDTLQSRGLPLLQQAPIVTMRLQEVRDEDVVEMRKDTTDRYEKWVLNNELRVTYRDYLQESEELVEGSFPRTDGDTVFVSVADGLVDALNLKLGDRIVYDVQGVPLETYVGSIRRVNWQQFSPNFLTVFPPGVLEAAPQFHVIVTRVSPREKAAQFQRAMVQAFPNVSIIDLALVLQTVENVLDQISFVIRFMASFTILTGVIVLIGALTISRFQRLTESVLLRTLGASRQIVRRIMTLEYVFLGSLAALLGILMALATSALFTVTVFDELFQPPWLELGGLFAALCGLTVAIGWLNSRGIFDRSPLEVLRQEA